MQQREMPSNYENFFEAMFILEMISYFIFGKTITYLLSQILFSRFIRGGHYNKMAYDEFHSIFLACSQMRLILFYLFSL